MRIARWFVSLLGLIGCGWPCLASPDPGPKVPNILWITCEDINPHLGCYGDTYARTPNLDRFATQALRYSHCWSTAPVCAPARTTLITGLDPTSLGAEHMRSALGQHGSDADLALALPVLRELAPADRNGAYVSMLDLNAIAALGQKAAPFLDTIRTMPTRDPSAVDRANTGVARLVTNITAQLEARESTHNPPPRPSNP